MQELKDKNNALLVKYNIAHNEYKVKLHLLIAKLLENPNLFGGMYIDKALNLLYDLGYDVNSAMQKYISLVSKQQNS